MADIFGTVLKSFMGNFLEFLENYFEMELEGIENIPDEPCIIYANHSGFNGLDGMLLSYSIKKNTGKLFKMVTHPFWFQNKYLINLSKDYGLIYASLKAMIRNLEKGESLIIFPEGEGGNFKNSNKMYQLQKFRSGLARLALRQQVPVIPCTILGAEESAITLTKIKINKFFTHGLNIPVPLNLIPFPAKWYIKFHDPIDTRKYDRSYVNNPVMIKKIQRLWQKRLQLRLYRELKNRPRIFVDGPIPFI